MPFVSSSLSDIIAGEDHRLLDPEGAGHVQHGSRDLSVVENAPAPPRRAATTAAAAVGSALLLAGIVAGASRQMASSGGWRPAHEARVGKSENLWYNPADSWQAYNREHREPATPAPVSQAPLREYYMYRAIKRGALQAYSFGDINTGNMDGVIWYLMNEVVTEYAAGPRCPRKFNISEIHRFKIRSRATNELQSEGMNFGPRFAFDQGMCRGRCFVNNSCSCQPDCDYHYKKYGHVVGCNNFKDKYPFPDKETAAVNGIWYALPLKGRCDYPTGAHDCTWSYEHAGMIKLEDIEELSPGGKHDNCCHGKCTTFWDDLYDVGKTFWRVNQALDTFKKKYPDMPRDLEPAMCDFNWWKWYNPDLWAKMDPWKRDALLDKGRRDPLKMVDPLLNATLMHAFAVDPSLQVGEAASTLLPK